jgi:hypothetical protein
MIDPYKADWRIQRKDLLSQRSKGAKDPPRRTSLPLSILIRLKTKKIRSAADLENRSQKKLCRAKKRRRKSLVRRGE